MNQALTCDCPIGREISQNILTSLQESEVQFSLTPKPANAYIYIYILKILIYYITYKGGYFWTLEG